MRFGCIHRIGACVWFGESEGVVVGGWSFHGRSFARLRMDDVGGLGWKFFKRRPGTRCSARAERGEREFSWRWRGSAFLTATMGRGGRWRSQAYFYENFSSQVFPRDQAPAWSCRGLRSSASSARITHERPAQMRARGSRASKTCAFPSWSLGTRGGRAAFPNPSS